MSVTKFAEFASKALGINKNRVTFNELFRDKLGLTNQVVSNKGIGSFVDQDFAKITINSKRADIEKVDSNKFLKNFYNQKVDEDGIIQITRGEGKTPLADIASAYNTKKLINEDAPLTLLREKLKLYGKGNVQKQNRVEAISQYLDKKESETLNSVLNLGYEKSYKNLFINLIQKEFPSNSNFTALKKFYETYPTERSILDFLSSNKNKIDALSKSYGLKPISSTSQANIAHRIKSDLPVNQRQALMSEKGISQSNVMLGLKEPGISDYGNIRKKTIAAYQPDTLTTFYRSGPQKLFEALFRNSLEGKTFLGYDQNLKRIKSPISQYTVHHRTPVRSIIPFQKNGIPNELIESLGFDNLMILANPSNRVLSKFENQATNYIKQALNFETKLRSLMFANKTGFITSQQQDQIPKLYEKLIILENKINDLKNFLPSDLQKSFNPINISVKKGPKFEPIQKFSYQFTGKDIPTKKARGIVQGLLEQEVPLKTIKKAYDKAYLNVLNEVKAGKFAQSYPETMVVPFEKIKYKLKKGGIVDLIRKVK